jgi:hypothetical protein
MREPRSNRGDQRRRSLAHGDTSPAARARRRAGGRPAAPDREAW